MIRYLKNTRLALPLLSAATLLSCIGFNSLEGSFVWSAPYNLSAAGKNAVNPQVATSADGHAAVLWSRSNGSNYIIESSHAKLAGRWSAPQRLSNLGQNAFFGNIAMDGSDNCMAVWARSNGTSYIIQASYKAAGKDWQAPANISIIGNKKNNATTPQVVMDSAGNATVVWARYNGSKSVIQSASKKVGRPWSPPADLTNLKKKESNCIEPKVTINSAGTAFAVWINATKQKIVGATKPLNGSWSKHLQFSAAGNQVSSPQIAVNPTNHATAVWSRYNGENFIIETASVNLSGTVSSPIDLSLTGNDAINPQIAIDNLGNKIAVWQRYDGHNTIIQGTVQVNGGNWSAPTDLSTTGQDASDPQVQIDPSGNIVVIWKISNGANFVIEATNGTFSPTSSWSAPYVLSDAGEDAVTPQLSVDSSGHIVVVWLRSDGTNTIVQTSVGTNVVH